MDHTTAETLEGALTRENTYERSANEAANVVDGLFAIARAIEMLAGATYALGNGTASTPFGAIEAMSMHLKEGLDGIASAVASLDSE